MARSPGDDDTPTADDAGPDDARPAGTEDMPGDDDSLAEYRRKRDFERTPEPAGAPGSSGSGAGKKRARRSSDGPRGRDERSDVEAAEAEEREVLATNRFVVHQHDATRLHWDLRLEDRGVLWSFALPRGLPWDPKRNNLAVHTEDHPLEYIDFEGDIPSGTYGAGNMFVWDHGDYDLLEREDGKLLIRLRGQRVQGLHALFRTGTERDWMIHRMDPPADPERRWPPGFVPPMLATPTAAADLPDGSDEWAWEVRLSGMRCMVTLLQGTVGLHDAQGNDISPRFADVRRMGRATGSVEAVLDGVLVGQPQHLERRFALKNPMTAKRAAESAPVQFVAFDLVWLDGHPRWDRPWDERRADLDALALDGPAWSASPAHRGDGPALLAAAGQNPAVTGLVGKRRTSTYRPGATSPHWLEVTLT
jgi:bifunctional non-homologous end joining protein LigD